MSQALSLTVLGGFTAFLGPSPLPLPKKTQALVAYLALESKSVHSRTDLATLLWGDTGDEQAMQSLRKALSVFRQQAGDPADDILVIHDGGIGINRAAISVDAIEFERLAHETAAEPLARAAALYRGQLLAGLDLDEGPFNEWLLSRRERLRELAVGTFAQLLDHHVAANALDPAIETATKLFELEPLHEAAHRALIQIHGRHGRRAAAARHYQLFVDALYRELGVRPEPSTEAAYRESIAPRPSGAAPGDPIVYQEDSDLDTVRPPVVRPSPPPAPALPKRRSWLSWWRSR